MLLIVPHESLLSYTFYGTPRFVQKRMWTLQCIMPPKGLIQIFLHEGVKSFCKHSLWVAFVYKSSSWSATEQDNSCVIRQNWPIFNPLCLDESSVVVQLIWKKPNCKIIYQKNQSHLDLVLIMLHTFIKQTITITFLSTDPIPSPSPGCSTQLTCTTFS